MRDDYTPEETAYWNGRADERKEWGDKIKAKIKEQLQTGWKTKEERWQQNYALDILQSLLEKE